MGLATPQFRGRGQPLHARSLGGMRPLWKLWQVAAGNAVRRGMLTVGGASLVQMGAVNQQVIDVIDKDQAP